MSATTEIRGKSIFLSHIWRLDIGVATVGVFTRCTGLGAEFEVFEYAEGGNNDMIHHLPGRKRYPNLVLTGGLTNETVLIDWFWKTHEKAEPKEVTVTLEQEGGQLTRAWTFADAYPIRWSGPDLDTHAGAIATETLEIAHSGLRKA
jgi:phage tail-like protein